MTEQVKEPYEVAPENAKQVWDWFQQRGGICRWESANLANPGASWTGPLYNANGGLSDKPTWQAQDKPARVVTDPDEVVVLTGREVKRLKVAIRASGNGLSLKLTDASSRNLRLACDKFKDSWYEFDYSTQQAVIYVPAEKVPLRKFIENLAKVGPVAGTITEEQPTEPKGEQQSS